MTHVKLTYLYMSKLHYCDVVERGTPPLEIVILPLLARSLRWLETPL